MEFLKKQPLSEKNSLEKSSESGDLRSPMQPTPSMGLAKLSEKKDPDYQLFHEENFSREILLKKLLGRCPVCNLLIVEDKQHCRRCGCHLILLAKVIARAKELRNAGKLQDSMTLCKRP